MNPQQKQKRIPRTAYTVHLFFSLVALVVLVAGLTWLVEKQRRVAFENKCLLNVKRAESAIVVGYLCDGPERLDSLIDQINSNQGFLFCAVVDQHGTFVAHSQTEKTGTIYREPVGRRNELADVREVCYRNSDQIRVRQYSCELGTKDQGSIGTLKVGIKDYGKWQVAWNMFCELPLVLLIPLMLIFAGGSVMLRLLQPTAEIHRQLSKIAGTPQFSPSDLQPVDVRNGVSIGWNRLTDEVTQLVENKGLTARLSDAIEDFQTEHDQNLLETLPYGVAETDAEGRITFINKAMETLLGIDSEPVTDQTIEECLNVEGNSESFSALLSPQSQGRVGGAEINRSSSLGQRIIKVTRHPMRGTHDGKSCAGHQAWSARDITQLKLADKAKSEFLDSATHEIRTPLANIKAYAETLAVCEMNDVEQQKEFCNIINGEATRLARFIDELLDVSSLEAGSLTIKRQKIELDRFLDAIVDKVQPTMSQKQLAFTQSFDDKLPEIIVDKDKFSTCVINLLGNAAKYTPEGGKVDFRVKSVEDRLVFEIEDSGLGISKEDLPRVFDKFFRSDDERVHAETGSGLGLAFTREIILLHGGNVTVSSELNNGSTFTISLPLEQGNV